MSCVNIDVRKMHLFILKVNFYQSILIGENACSVYECLLIASMSALSNRVRFIGVL